MPACSTIDLRRIPANQFRQVQSTVDIKVPLYLLNERRDCYRGVHPYDTVPKAGLISLLYNDKILIDRLETTL